MVTDSIIVGTFALGGAFGAQIISYVLRSRREHRQQKQAFFEEIIEDAERIISAFDAYLSDYSMGDDIDRSEMSRARSRSRINNLRDKNFVKPHFVSNDYIEKLREWRSVFWELDALGSPSGNLTGEDAIEYLDTMIRLRDLSEEVREIAVDELNSV